MTAILATDIAGAQAGAQIEIVAVEHDPRGIVTVTVVDSGGQSSDPQQWIAFVDGVQRDLEVLPAEGTPSLSIVIAVETSSSMAGGRLEAAQAAASAVIDQLAPGDEVAVLSFGDDVTVVQPLSTDRLAARAAVSRFTTTSASSLYGGVAAAAALLEQAAAGPKAVVLLTYGWNFGRPATTDRDGSLALVGEAGAPVYVVALGRDYDSSYLSELATSTGGEFWPALSDAGLEAAIASLGAQPNTAVRTLRVSVPALPLGEHELTVRAGANDAGIDSRSTFDVSNEGLLSAYVAESPADGGTLTVQLSALTGLDALSVVVTANGRTLTVDGDAGRIIIDPWTFDPGPLRLDVEAWVDGQLAAVTEASVAIPALAPELELQLNDPAAPTELAASWRVQGAGPSVLVVSIAGVEVARTTERQIRIPLTARDAGGEIVAHLEASDGGILATRSLSALPALPAVSASAAPGSTSGGVSPAIVVAASVAAMLALGVLLWRFRGRSGGDGSAPAPRSGPRLAWRSALAWPRRLAPRVPSLRQSDAVVRPPRSRETRLTWRSALSWVRRETRGWDGSGSATEEQLREALEDGQFIVHYQPVVDAFEGTLRALEALVRWRQPDGRVIAPGRFMGAADRSGVIVELGEFVLRTACAMTRSLQREQFPELRVSVNLSRRQLLDPGLPQMVQRALDDADLAPRFLQLEVGERTVAFDLDGAAAAIARLRAIGVSTMLDDFGLGPESLERLRRLDIEAVKVDLWAATHSDVAEAAVLEAVALAHSLGVAVTAKRVETREELEFFRRLDVEYVQGYAFGEPALAPAVGGAQRPPSAETHLSEETDRVGEGPSADDGDATANSDGAQPISLADRRRSAAASRPEQVPPGSQRRAVGESDIADELYSAS